MEIRQLFLEDKNTTPCGKRTVGEMVQMSGKHQLWSARPQPSFDVVVVHYMSAVVNYPEDPYNIESIVEIFGELQVSSHFVIDRNGVVYQCVPDTAKAWHAGGSIMPSPDDRRNVNDFSIGIELLATEQSGFTHDQYESLAATCKTLEYIANSTLTYVGHEQIAGIRAVECGLRNNVKKDPGALFEWETFYRLKNLG